MEDGRPNDKLLDISTRVKVLKAGLERLHKSIEKPPETPEGEQPPPMHPLTKVAMEFITSAEKSIASLETSLAESNDTFAALAKLYCFEDRFKADDFQSNAVFELLLNFIKQLDRAQQAASARQAQKKKKQAAAALRESQKKAQEGGLTESKKVAGSSSPAAKGGENKPAAPASPAAQPMKPGAKGVANALASGSPGLRRFSTRAVNVVSKKADTTPPVQLSADMDKWRAGSSVLDDIINDVMADFQLTEKEVRSEKRHTKRA